MAFREKTRPGLKLPRTLRILTIWILLLVLMVPRGGIVAGLGAWIRVWIVVIMFVIVA